MGARSVHLSYLFHLLTSEFGNALFFSLGLAISSLTKHVVNILLLSTQHKMRRIYAEWIIAVGAVVADVVSMWDFAVGKHVGIAMSTGQVRSCPKLTVSIQISGCRPEPTAARGIFVHLGPESSFGVGGLLPPKLMPLDESRGFTPDKTFGLVARWRKGGSLPTTARAKPTWVWAGGGICFWLGTTGVDKDSGVVPFQVGHWLTLDVPRALVVLLDYLGLLPAPATTISVASLGRDILAHVRHSFQCVAMPGALVALPGFAIGLDSNYTTIYTCGKGQSLAIR